jgi:hypothetical protein
VEQATEPKIALRQISLARDTRSSLWNVGWEIDNQGAEVLTILSARLPHGQFKSAEFSFRPALTVGPGARERFTIAVTCQEPVGLVTENAFVIFHCHWRREAWRIFVRIRVVVNSRGEPEAATELITTQKVGFSGISN